jgi:hypothetical protein
MGNHGALTSLEKITDSHELQTKEGIGGYNQTDDPFYTVVNFVLGEALLSNAGGFMVL